MMKYRAAVGVFIFFALITPAVYSYSDPEYDSIVYKGNFFVLLEPSGPFEPDQYDEELAIRQLLEEARYVFSGMIYGFKFDYIPQDNSRGVSEEFVLESVHTIPWGDPGLSAPAGKYKDGRYDSDMRYEVSEEQLPWIISWDTNVLSTVTAVGEGSQYAGAEGKIEAVNNSIKESLRNYLRPRIFNKPRRITGTARLSAVPYIAMDSGKFLAMSKITLRFDDILEYKVY